MSCAAFGARLDLYLDGELGDADLPALEGHIATCASCAAEALRRRELMAAIRDAGARFRAGPRLTARVERSLAGRRRPSLATWLIPLAAALLAGIGLAFYQGLARADREHALGELLDVHVATLASTSPVDVVSTDRHTVKPWFEGKLPFTFDLPDLAGTPFELVGGRVAWLRQAPAAQLMIRLRSHRISVFVLAEGTDAARALSGVLSSGRAPAFRVVTWSGRGLRFVAVGDTNRDDLELLAASFRRAAAG